jgi:hypothetical protein
MPACGAVADAYEAVTGVAAEPLTIDDSGRRMDFVDGEAGGR